MENAPVEFSKERFLIFIVKQVLICSFLFFGILLCNAQKDTREIFDASDIHKIEIYADEVYKISLYTSGTEEIKISTHSEGEYYNNIFLVTEVEKQTLKLSSRFPKALTGGYDKLSAHKIISMEIKLEVPENIQVFISSNLASVEAGGSFKYLFADLKDGYCRLLSFKGKATVNTYKGNIYVETTPVNVQAKSRNGIVYVQPGIRGTNLLKLKSINGDIRVLRTK
ncbi:hypothetical protein RM549_08125 [Salegentibacter sp. F188]|uniref:Adhesin domain-containing protein n=1 Tax=Autumnicola patrickiae TaxID=3075591 RepID=A0ABU3E1D6_9FLAO|nr:hypothetical protein [Salegentibacter sp. F188]MDT0689747.1 hypothetical protein [Salegentibacter sp. F188]